ncbi:hypothetical protein Avbf_00902, partial [Armadillidium vulgare]
YLGKHIFNILLKDNTCVIKVICTLESIDSIKIPEKITSTYSLLRNYKFMHILIVLGPGSGVQFPGSEFRFPGFRVPGLNNYNGV